MKMRVPKNFTVSERIAILEEIEATRINHRQKKGANLSPLSFQEKHKGEKSRAIVAAYTGTSPAQLQKEKKIVNAARNDPTSFGQLLERVDSGRIHVDKAVATIKRELEEQEELRKAESVPAISKANFNDRCKLFNDDFRQVNVKEIADNSIQLIFVDPPYERKYLPIYDDLSKIAARTLVPGGSLITYLRQYDIPTILHYMENAGLNYNWIPSIKLQGQFARAMDKHIVIKQKTLVLGTSRVTR